MELIYGQYDGKLYPLKKYYIVDIPVKIMDCIWKISNSKIAIIRGGLSFILLFGRVDYQLKDIDMITSETDERKVISFLDKADRVYVNKNSFDEVVVTAFWKLDKDYIKIDILMGQPIDDIKKCEWNNKEYLSITPSFLWMNRMCKIDEKIQRKHDDNKTINHYQVARYICKYMLKNNIVPNNNYLVAVNKKLSNINKVLSKIIDDVDVKEFIEINQKLLSRGIE